MEYISHDHSGVQSTKSMANSNPHLKEYRLFIYFKERTFSGSHVVFLQIYTRGLDQLATNPTVSPHRLFPRYLTEITATELHVISQ